MWGWCRWEMMRLGPKATAARMKRRVACVGPRVCRLDIEYRNPRTWEPASGGFQVWDHSEFHSQILFQKASKNILLPCLWMEIYQGVEKMPPVCCRIWVASCCRCMCHSVTSWKLSCGHWYLRVGCKKVKLGLTTTATNCTQRRWGAPPP